MKKIMIGLSILLVFVMFSPAMAQDGSTERLNRKGDRIDRHLNTRGDRHGDGRIERGKNQWRDQRSIRFSNFRGHYGNQKYSRFNHGYRRHMYSRYHNRYKRHLHSRYHNRYKRHLYHRFNNRFQRHKYSHFNHRYYWHRKNW